MKLPSSSNLAASVDNLQRLVSNLTALLTTIFTVLLAFGCFTVAVRISVYVLEILGLFVLKGVGG